VPAGRGDPQTLEQAFLSDPILAGGERSERRANARVMTARDAGEACDRDVLPVEGDDFALPREACEQAGIGERAVQ